MFLERAADRERFWSKVNKAGPVVKAELGACWSWEAGKNGKGYGSRHSDRNRPLGQRRIWPRAPIDAVADVIGKKGLGYQALDRAHRIADQVRPAARRKPNWALSWRSTDDRA